LTVPKTKSTYEKFIVAASDLTGFPVSELEGTGQARIYFQHFEKVLGKKELAEFVDYLSKNKPEHSLKTSYSALARNVIWLFYFGQWKRVPDVDVSKTADNIDQIVSSEAFRSGLGWQAIGANPPGAKFPGFRSWSQRPRT